MPSSYDLLTLEERAWVRQQYGRQGDRPLLELLSDAILFAKGQQPAAEREAEHKKQLFEGS